MSAVDYLYDTLKPTTKKVLSSEREGERDASKFLQRFVRGMGMSKLVQFLRFTTGMDILVARILRLQLLSVRGWVQDLLLLPKGLFQTFPRLTQIM